MATSSRSRGLARARSLLVSRASLLAFGTLFALVALLLAYVAVTGTTVTSTRHTLLPVVWLVASVWLVVHLHDTGPARDRPRFGAVVGVAYFALLGAIAGVFGLPTGTGTTVVSATPGWGPVVAYGGLPISVVVIPFEVAGYLALSYAVYRAVAATSRGALTGVVGLFSCIGCVLPVLAAIGGIFGGTITAALQPGGFTYDVATAVFLVTVVLLAVTTPSTDARS